MPWLVRLYVEITNKPWHARLYVEIIHELKRVNYLTHRRTNTVKLFHTTDISVAEPRSAVGNVSGYRYVSDCRSRGGEFDPGPVPYFRGD